VKGVIGCREEIEKGGGASGRGNDGLNVGRVVAVGACMSLGVGRGGVGASQRGNCGSEGQFPQDGQSCREEKHVLVNYSGDWTMEELAEREPSTNDNHRDQTWHKHGYNIFTTCSFKKNATSKHQSTNENSQYVQYGIIPFF
jgi:hypothetical protein